LPNGRPNLGTVSSWLGTASYCYLVKRYDQLGTGNDEAQATAANKPFFSLDNVIRGHYGVLFDQAIKASTWLDMPAAITGNGQATSVVEVVAYASSNAACTGLVGAAYTTAGSLSLLPAQNGENKYQVLTSSAFLKVANGRSRSQTQVSTVTSGASAIKVYQDNNAVQSLSANTAGTWVGGKTGYVTTGGYLINGLHFAKIIYPSELSAGNIASLHTFLYSAFDVLTSATGQIIWPGHSGVQGTGATQGKNITYYTEPLLNRRVFISNQGKFGQTASQIYADRAKYAAQYNASLQKNICFGADAANDLINVASGSVSGFGATAWSSFVLPFIQAMQAAGFSVIQQVMIPLTWPTDSVAREAERQSYNTLVRSNAGTYGYKLLDYETNANLTTVTVGNYWSADGVHLSNKGYAEESPIAAAAINSLLQ